MSPRLMSWKSSVRNAVLGLQQFCSVLGTKKCRFGCLVVPPLVRLDRAEMREREGSTFTVQCIAEGHPPPKIEWTRSTGGLFRIGTNVDLA